jgi:hypothetical protein
MKPGWIIYLLAIRRYQMDVPVKIRVGLRRPFCSMMENMRWSSSAVAFVPPIRAYPEILIN